MEHEITGHTRKIYKIFKAPDLPLKHKLKEIGIEILIIVFAVSLAGFLEKQREVSRERQETKAFLLGLKTDLQSDLNGIGEDFSTFKNRRKALIYFYKAPQNADTLAISTDSLKKYYYYIAGLQELLVRKGRYEGFKSAGKISSIENTALQNKILTYYEDYLPIMQVTVAYNNNYQNKLHEMISDQISFKHPFDAKLKQVLAQPKVYNYMAVLINTTSESIERYTLAINLAHEIDKAITEEYK